MTKYICIAVLLIGFLSSCTTQRGIGCDAVRYMAQIDTTQTDSLAWIEYNGVDCENCDEIN